MKTSVIILKETPDTWTLKLTLYIGTDEERVTRIMFRRLQEALDAANQLCVQVDNEDELPLTQYPKAV